MSRMREGQLRIGTEIWLREDIRNVLIAIDAANGDMARAVDCKEVQIFRAGFQSAMAAVASAFDLDWDSRPVTCTRPLLTGGDR